MKKMNKKRGFTITELVIVISVIGILSAVLIPTFSGLVGKSRESAAMQEANHALTAVFVANDGQLEEGKTYYFISGKYTYEYKGGKLVEVKDGYTADDNDKTYTNKDWEDLGNVTVIVAAPNP